MNQIFKIQRPIVTSDPEPKCLVYNQDRSIYGQIPLTAEVVKELFPNGELKQYVRGSFDPQTGDVTLDELVGEQDW